jgi:hypothetical protein
MNLIQLTETLCYTIYMTGIRVRTLIILFKGVISRSREKMTQVFQYYTKIQKHLHMCLLLKSSIKDMFGCQEKMRREK